MLLWRSWTFVALSLYARRSCLFFTFLNAFFLLSIYVQVALFSATMPLDVLEVTNRFMPDPVRILVKKDELTLEGEACVLDCPKQRKLTLGITRGD